MISNCLIGEWEGERTPLDLLSCFAMLSRFSNKHKLPYFDVVLRHCLSNISSESLTTHRPDLDSLNNETTFPVSTFHFQQADL